MPRHRVKVRHALAASSFMPDSQHGVATHCIGLITSQTHLLLHRRVRVNTETHAPCLLFVTPYYLSTDH